MKELYKNHLFNKRILVNDSQTLSDNPFEAVFAFAKLLSINITKGQELASLELIKFASNMLGRSVPNAFYKEFPKSVRKLSSDELLFDQLLHYTATYGFNNFSEPGYSVMEKNFKRVAFKEKVEPKDFVIVNEKDAVLELNDYIKNLLTSTRPLNDYQYEVVLSALCDYNFTIENCPCKDTAIRLIIDTKNTDFARLLNLSDFIKLVEMVNYYSNDSVNVNKINLKNKDRVLLSKVLDILLSGEKLNIKDCFEKQKAWCAYLHHLHYKPKTEVAVDFVNAIRNGKNQSAYSSFEKAVGDGDIKTAIETLLKYKGSSAFMRKLNYLLSRCKTEEEIAFVLDKIGTKNNIVIIQMLMQYHNYRAESARTFTFTKFNRLRTHTESKTEFNKRKSIIPSQTIDKIIAVLNDNLKSNLSGKLGKVFIDKDMQKIALPIQENTSMGGFGTLPKGSRIDLPKGKKIRAFTYWEKVNDIDLSIIGIDDKLNQYEFSWRTMSNNQSKAITFSGDQTSGYHGGSEYFDLNLDAIKKLYPKCRYFILCDNVFSGTPFNQCICKAGFMMRDTKDSGEIFEPKTVQTSYTINCNSTFAYLFAIDVEKRQIVWINSARESNEIVAGCTSLAFLLDYLNAVDIINVYSLFTMLSSEVVTNAEDADVVVTDKELIVKEDAIVIKSYDTDKILPLING